VRCGAGLGWAHKPFFLRQICVESALFFGPYRSSLMVTIRLTRRGAKNQPFYHVVVTDSRKRQGGSSLEQVGYFNPVARGKDTRLKLDLERIDHWLKIGAHESDRVRQLVAGYRKDISQQAAAA
jgi:small subunit ribosomal protein S16